MLGRIDLLVHHVREWPVASQQQARRNAMLAATDCAARRAQREDVDDYLAALTAPSSPSSPGSPGSPGSPSEQAPRPQHAVRS